MRTLEQIGEDIFAPLGTDSAAVLGGTAEAQRICILGYALIDGQLYPTYAVDTDASTPAPAEPASR